MAEFAGDLRETVVIEQWTAADPGDSAAGAWIDAGCAWAALVPVDPNLVDGLGERGIGRPRFRLTLRAPTCATVTSRFRWQRRILAVVRAEPDPRLRDRLTFLVEDRT